MRLSQPQWDYATGGVEPPVMFACSLDFVFSEMILQGLTRFGFGETFFHAKGRPTTATSGVFGAENWGSLLEHGEAIF